MPQEEDYRIRSRALERKEGNYAYGSARFLEACKPISLMKQPFSPALPGLLL